MITEELSTQPIRVSIARAFGRVLRERPKSQRISQHELALRTDVDRTYASPYERGW